MRRFSAIVTLVVLVGAIAIPAFANGQDTCPEGDGWVKVDDLSGLTYTFDVPEGFEVTDNCFKASTTLVFGSGPTVENTTVVNHKGKLQDISHASFLLVPIDDEEEEETTTTTTLPEDDDDTTTTSPTTTLPESTTTVDAPTTSVPDNGETPSTVDTPTTVGEPVVTTPELTELPFTGPNDGLFALAKLLFVFGSLLIVASLAMGKDDE